MEALIAIIIVAWLLANVPGFVVVMLGIEGFLTLCALLVELAFRVVYRVAVGRKAQSAPPPVPVALPEEDAVRQAVEKSRFSTFRLWSRRVTLACVVVTGVSLVALLAANFLFFDAVIRAISSRAASRTGIILTFDDADGNLFTGEVRLKNTHVVRSGHAVSDYDLEVEELDLKFALSSLFSQERRLSRLAVQGVSGSFDRKGKQEETPKKPFAVDHLTIGNARVDLTDQTAPGGVAQATLEIDGLRVDGYQSEWAIWDLMFRSNTKGRIDGHPLSITSSTEGGENSAVWKAERVPVPLLVNYLSGPFQMLKDGYATVEVTNRWGPEEFPQVDLGWRIEFHDLKAEVPEEAHPAMAVFAKPAAAYLNSHENRLPLVFHVVVDKRAFHGKTSLVTVGLWTDVGESASRTFQELVGAKFDVVVDKVKELKDAAMEKAGPQLGKAKEAGKKAAGRLKGLFKRGEGDEPPGVDNSPDAEKKDAASSPDDK